jgi:hypothetical protein
VSWNIGASSFYFGFSKSSRYAMGQESGTAGSYKTRLISDGGRAGVVMDTLSSFGFDVLSVDRLAYTRLPRMSHTS